MKNRNSYSEIFLNDFKRLYARLGTDIDCYGSMMDLHGKQHPDLTPQRLTLIRRRRSGEFTEARNELLAEIKVNTGKQDMDLLVESKGLNSRLVRQMLLHQEAALESMTRLPITDGNADQHKSLLSYCVQLQTQINKFSGVDANAKMLEFRQRLIDKRIVEDSSDLDRLMDSMTTSGKLESNETEELPEFLELDDEEEI